MITTVWMNMAKSLHASNMVDRERFEFRNGSHGVAQHDFFATSVCLMAGIDVPRNGIILAVGGKKVESLRLVLEYSEASA
jgi:hypothetical protein